MSDRQLEQEQSGRGRKVSPLFLASFMSGTDSVGETCMKRWTDGKRWGASRVGQGGFLLYAE
jgi:hypothetical protein